MSFLINPRFPRVCPWTIAVGVVYTHAVGLAFSKVGLGRFCNCHQHTEGGSTTDSCAASTCCNLANAGCKAWFPIGAAVVGSSLQSYAVAGLLKLAGSNSVKGASIVGFLLFTIQSLPCVFKAVVCGRTSCHKLCHKLLISFMDTVGLAIAFQLYWGNKGLPSHVLNQ